MSLGDHRDRARRVFQRAVQCELDAIRLHESAALRLEEMARRLDRAALEDRVELLRQEAQATAANARLRAHAARARAAEARKRLRDEGIDPDAVLSESGQGEAAERANPA